MAVSLQGFGCAGRDPTLAATGWCEHAGQREAPAVPGLVEPCHPTLREKAPSGGRWVHGIKSGGYRTQAHLRKGRPTIYTRAGYDWTRRFQPNADALATLPATDLILDGEAVVVIRAASLISGCCTPISQRVARTGCSTTPSTCSISTARSARSAACRAQAPARCAADGRVRTHPLRRAPGGRRRRDLRARLRHGP